MPWAGCRQDRLPRLPLAEAVKRLLRESRIDRIMARYEELQSDPLEWAGYRDEARLTDNVAGDGLPSARDEYPEQNG